MAKTQRVDAVEDAENFEDIGKLTAAQIRQPALYPTGPWTLQNVGFSEADAEDRDGNPQKCYTLRYVGFEPGDEVDPEQVAEGGFEGRTIWVRRYISKPAAKAARDGTLARFVNFVAMHGVDTDGLDVDGMLKALNRTMILGDIGQRSYTNRNGDEVNDNTASNFASVE